jgi:malonate decarboxylase beta subunit
MATSAPYHEMTARGRLEAVIDDGSFVEFIAPPERETSPYLEKLGQPIAFDDGIVIGRAKIGERTVYIAAQEGSFVGGAVGEVHGAKLTGLLKASARDRVPCVLLVESGGVRLHEGSSGEIGIAEAIRAVFACRAAGVPTIAVIGSDIGAYGGMGILTACCDHRVMTEHGRLGVSGPIVIQKWMGVDAYDASDRALVWMTSGGKTKYVLGDADGLVDDDAANITAAVVPLLTSPNAIDINSLKTRHDDLAQRLERFGDDADGATIWQANGITDIPAAKLATATEFVALLAKETTT